MEAYIYTYVNKETGKTYIGSRSRYEGSCYDDFNIKYFSSSKDKQFRQDMKDGKLEGQIVLVMNDEKANKKIIDVESQMITAYWEKYGKENSYNHHNNNGKFSTSGMQLEFSDEHKQHMKETNHWKGKHLSEEHKQKIGETRKRKGIKPWNTGKKWDEATKEKNRQSNLGRKGWNKGKSPTEDTLTKMRNPRPKYKWLTPNGEIKEMDLGHAHKWHPDWIKIGE